MTAQNLVNTPDNRLVVAVDGPSGVGKSTLLLSMCGLLPTHAGTVGVHPDIAAGSQSISGHSILTQAPCTVPLHLRCCGPA